MLLFFFFFFFNDTATTEIYTLSLHDALPISRGYRGTPRAAAPGGVRGGAVLGAERGGAYGAQPPSPLRRRMHHRSEEHTSELQSQSNLVCRLLLEKKKQR